MVCLQNAFAVKRELSRVGPFHTQIEEGLCFVLPVHCSLDGNEIHHGTLTPCPCDLMMSLDAGTTS